MKRKDIEQRVTELVNKLLTDESIALTDVDLLDVEYVKEGQEFFLRVFIDKAGGVTINDCEVLSRQMDRFLDEHDWIKEQYYLEVSSPGLDRPLKKPEDFNRNVGKKVEVRLYQLFEGEKHYQGVLIERNEEGIIIETDDQRQIAFSEAQVALVKLAIIF